MDSRSGGESLWVNASCLVGFGSLTTALLVAHAHPASAYELSIYDATPVGFWIGVGVAFVIGAFVAISATDTRYRLLGVYLGALASIGVVGLRIIRGYHFHGYYDPMTHVGIVRELTNEMTTPVDTAYPSVHTLALFIRELTGLSIWQSALFVPLVLVALSFVFVPFVVGAIVDGETAVVVGVFSAFLLVPIHQLNVTLLFHPSSQAILFTPLVLFLLIRYLRSPTDAPLYGVGTPIGVSLLLTTVTMILYHPMQGLNVIVLLITITTIQSVAAWWDGTLPWTEHRRLTGVCVLSTIAYVAWTANSPEFVTTVEIAISSLHGYFEGTSTTAGSAVGSQTSSLQAIGANPAVMYVKLFTVSTVYIVVAGLVVVDLARKYIRRDELNAGSEPILWYLVFSLAAMALIFLLYLFGDVGQYYFRQASFMMGIVTIFGAVGIAIGVDSLSKTRFRRGARLGLTLGVAVLFLLSALVIFDSPYLHRGTQHVTEAEVDGYNLAFETTDDTAEISGVRQHPQWYYEALIDMRDSGSRSDTVNSTNLHRLQERSDDEWYLILSQKTYEIEVDAYREYRYSRSDLESVEHQPMVNRVFSNGDTDLYHVP